MKKFIAFIPTWLLFYTGHLISETWKTRLNKNGYGYSIYRKCMIWSSDIQEWAGIKKPWTSTIAPEIKKSV